VTAILYANPDWAPANGGQLRLWLPPGSLNIASNGDHNDEEGAQQSCAAQQASKHMSRAAVPTSHQTDDAAPQRDVAAEQKPQRHLHINGRDAAGASVAHTDIAHTDTCSSNVEHHKDPVSSPLQDSATEHARQPAAAILHSDCVRQNGVVCSDQPERTDIMQDVKPHHTSAGAIQVPSQQSERSSTTG